MRSETKLVQTAASRSTLAGGGEWDRLLGNCRTPEILFKRAPRAPKVRALAAAARAWVETGSSLILFTS